MYYLKPNVNIIFIKPTVVFCCLLYCRSKENGGEGVGREGGTDGGVPMGYDYSVSGNIAKITLLICFEKRGLEGGGG
jgi:hypothetical protein